jgi:hypothetical protein
MYNFGPYTVNIMFNTENVDAMSVIGPAIKVSFI